MPKQKGRVLKQLVIVDDLKNDTNFSPLSKEITNRLTKEEKSKNGIFFTPVSIISKIMYVIKLNKIIVQTILEPSCGSCEIIHTINKYFNNIDIHGIEKNDTIYESIRNIDFCQRNNNTITLEQNDFLQTDTNRKYDLIIGNPPFFVLKKDDVDKKYFSLFEGRPNIFILFIIHSLSLLNDNGVIAFVLPSSFMNCLYYNKLRREIYNKYKILDIISCKEDKFLETQQETVVIVFQKITNEKKNNDTFTFINGDNICFNTKSTVRQLKKIIKKTNTLDSMGFSVGVGNVVWNQHKDILTDDSSKIRIVYSSDIKDGELILKKNKSNKSGTKHNYIDIENTTIKTYDKPTLITSRGYGVGTYSFDYCIVDLRENYVLENHIIAIKPKNDMNREAILAAYETIITSFNDERTKKFVSLYFGNSAINATELQYILPIY
jgi:adenine-specific DNA-methyltransferase